MHRTQGTLVFSASDLVKFAACEHLTRVELLAALNGDPLPEETDQLAAVMQERGAQHERLCLLPPHDQRAR